MVGATDSDEGRVRLPEGNGAAYLSSKLNLPPEGLKPTDGLLRMYRRPVSFQCKTPSNLASRFVNAVLMAAIARLRSLSLSLYFKVGNFLRASHAT
jgi:hypothetical protein